VKSDISLKSAHSHWQQDGQTGSLAILTIDISPIERVDKVTSGLTRIGTATLGLTVLATQLVPVSAKPLLSETCVKLVGEHVELRKGGIEASMDHGPEKAGETMKPEELAKIERYLFIEGQIRFRCPEIRLPGIKEPDLSKSKKSKIKKAKIKEAKPVAPKKPAGLPAPLPNRKPEPPKPPKKKAKPKPTKKKAG